MKDFASHFKGIVPRLLSLFISTFIILYMLHITILSESASEITSNQIIEDTV